MKFNLKESLSKMGLLLKENWYNSLQSSFEMNVLDFVKNELEANYENQNNSSERVSNNALAPWMAKVVQDMGGPTQMGTKELNSVRHAFEVILKWYISQDDSPVEAKAISSKKPKEAYKYSKSKLDKIEDAGKGAVPDDIKKWIDNGYVKLVPSSAGGGRVWVEVLNKEWFNQNCENNSKLGIACQANQGPGDRFVGGPYATYTLLGKPKDGSSDFYSTLLSIAINKEEGKYIEIKQLGNQQPGKQSANGYTDLGDVAVDFISQNPELKNINKFVDWGSQSIPSSCHSTWGASGALCYWMNSKPDLFNKLISKKTSVLDYHEALIRNTKGNEFFEEIELDIDTLLREDPERFIRRLAVYYGMRGEEVVEALNSMDFESFISQYGTDEIFRVLPTIVKLVSFNKFKEDIYPYIDFDSFLKNSTENEIRKVIKNIRNKENSPKKANVILSFILDNHKENIIAKFGGGAKGLAKLNNLFASPRLDQHQNYFSKMGKVFASLEGERVIAVTDDKLILDPKYRRNFLNRNKEWVKDLFDGTDSEKEIKFLKYILTNSSEQDRSKGLESEKDGYIKYYDEQYAKGLNPLPGVMQFARDKDLYSTISPPTNEKKFNEGIKVYKFDKKDFSSNKIVNDILKYYVKNSLSKGENKVADGIAALLETAKVSGVSDEVIKDYAFNKLSPEKVLKRDASYALYSAYINNLLSISENIPSINKEGIIDYAKSEKVKNSVKNSRSVTSELMYKELLNKIERNNLEEQKVRKYISNLLESNYRRKKESLNPEDIKKKRPHTPQ